MASRPELIQCCDELSIDHKGKSIDEMKVLIKKIADKKFIRYYHISGSKMSIALRKFLSLEYDFKFYKKDGTEVDYMGKNK